MISLYSTKPSYTDNNVLLIFHKVDSRKKLYFHAGIPNIIHLHHILGILFEKIVDNNAFRVIYKNVALYEDKEQTY